MEIWKDLTGYIGIYQVSSNGRIKSLPRKIVRKNGQVAKVKETILKPGTDRYGYSFVVLCKNRTKRTTAIHRLVAAAFIPNSENKPCVDHIDGVRFHNFVENLRWCTQDENMNYELAIRNKTKYNFPIEGVGYDGKVCVEFLNYKDAQKKGFDRTQIKKAVDTGKPYKGIHYRIKTEK
mgnify:CR=1 FL=1|jgi:hypothetical protein